MQLESYLPELEYAIFHHQIFQSTLLEGPAQQDTRDNLCASEIFQVHADILVAKKTEPEKRSIFLTPN